MSNRVRTYTHKGKSKNLLPLGDFHLGHENCNLDKVKEAIQWAIEAVLNILDVGNLQGEAEEELNEDAVYLHTPQLTLWDG